jgi:hypothetical protein
MVFNVTMVSFWMTLSSNKWTNIVMDVGWVHPPANSLPSLVRNLWWTIVMNDWNLEEKPLDKWQCLQHYKSIIPQIVLQGMTNNVGKRSMLATVYCRLQLVLRNKLRIDGTNYHIYFSHLNPWHWMKDEIRMTCIASSKKSGTFPKLERK